MPKIRDLTPILAAFILLSGIIFTAPDIEARPRRSAGRSSARQGRSVSRSRVRRRHAYAERDEVQAPAAHSIVPDKIEVYEYNGTNSQMAARYMKLPQPANPEIPAVSASVVRRNNLVMDSTRVVEIQQALTSRGFFTGEVSGVYDDATIEAMQKFQRSQKIPVTGYPTAHALKRLGLVN